ncbi:MAG: hypothetical protein OEZ43_21915 [Gammaproteobacteria bacterium]|nr:hypothetical protein [Gammaproteobacteria bacterium]
MPIASQYLSLVNKIDTIPNFRGLGVVAINDEAVSVIRKPLACFPGANYIVIETQTKPTPLPSPDSDAVWKEAGLAAINCGAATLAAIVVFTSAAATPVTGGTSLALTAVS